MKQNDNPADEVKRLKMQLRTARRKLRIAKSQTKSQAKPPQILTAMKKPVASVPAVMTNGKSSLLTMVIRAELQRTKEEIDELLKAS